MIVQTVLARRYANALFTLADEQGKVDVIARELTDLNKMIASSPELRRLVHAQALRSRIQSAAMLKILEKSSADALTSQFVGALCRNRRLNALPQIITVFLADLAERRGEVAAEIISAIPLKPAHEAGIIDAVSHITKSDKITLTTDVDPSLIGGLVLRIGSRLIDTSLKTKLNRLEAAMKGVG